MMRFTMLAVVIFFAALPASAVAQARSELQPGARVSVYAPSVSAQPTVGRLQAIDATGLRLALADGSSLDFPRNEVREIYVSRGMRSHTLTGTGIGALSGFALGATVAIIGISQDHDDTFDSLDRAVYTAFAIVSTATGAVAGTIFGALTRTEKWEQVFPSPVRWGLTPTLDGGVRVGVSLRF